ncbi:hypothetical protein NP233_g5400 [Leucocoprinus birnbaumii]|uniref:Uncharacterized protein n=1 Tax=Leucocoprinus birnbaumii TaxID=56174 RepID=A0AAD5VSY2_9AGAR|nr:hypothetical protein NP233_g5400 [Leucocoprinus birnbaumii]
MAETRNALIQVLSRINVVTFTTVEGTLYGLSFALYLTCCHLLLLELSKDKGRRKQDLFTLSHMSLVIICGLLTLVVDTRSIQESWVDHPTAAPGGSLFYWSNISTHLAFVDHVESLNISFLHHNDSQFDAPWVHRFALTFICGWILLVNDLDLVIEIVETYNDIGRPIFTHSQLLVINAVRQGMMMFTGLIVTSLISARIALVRRTHIQTMADYHVMIVYVNVVGKSDISNQYFSIISMLVESFALEFIWTTMVITTDFSPDNVRVSAVSQAFTNLLPSIQIIAYLLVVYRVSSRRAWEKDTEEKLTSLQWNRGVQQATQLTTTQASIHISGDAPGDEV